MADGAARIVMVPVPVARLEDVYRLLGNGGGPPPDGVSNADPSPEMRPGWTAQDLQRMTKESEKPMRSLLGELANQSGTWVPTDQLLPVIAKARGEKAFSRRQFAGMLGALGKRCQSRYDKPSLPFEVRWDGSQCQYRFGDAAAEAVLNALV